MRFKSMPNSIARNSTAQTDRWARTVTLSLLKLLLLSGGMVGLPQPALADPASTRSTQTDQTDRAAELDLDPALLEDSPVLERWLQEIPDVRSEMRNDPSFRTRIRFSYSQFPAAEQAAGLYIGVEDLRMGRTPLTLSGDYQRSFNGERESYGGNLHYYVLPLGSSINIAPVVGYRYLETDRYTTDGVSVGARVRLVPSRTGAADITLTQSWVAPGTPEEVGMSTLSFGYAIQPDLRLSTDLEKQNAPARKDSRISIGLEWMP